MSTTVTITGNPVVSFEFFDIITWNVFSNKHHKSKAGIARKFRSEGSLLAQEFKLTLSPWEREFYLVDTALILVKILPPKEEISDIHNVCLKHILDGFTDAGVFEDDEWAFVPLVIVMWAGIETDVQWRIKQARKGKQRRRARKRRTVIEIHELDALIINGADQQLPAGRTRI